MSLLPNPFGWKTPQYTHSLYSLVSVFNHNNSYLRGTIANHSEQRASSTGGSLLFADIPLHGWHQCMNVCVWLCMCVRERVCVGKEAFIIMPFMLPTESCDSVACLCCRVEAQSLVTYSASN